MPLTDEDRTALRLEHLERRRASIDQAMWQAPTLTIAAQAFLLVVLASDVDKTARLVVLAAGLVAVGAAIGSLFRQHSRERWFSERIFECTEQLDVRDVRPPPSRWPVYLAWVAALVLFGGADVAVFVA